jgi:pyruvate/2-oxoglutarate dehydrogenase complex dihydrolipoamide acyltransferase (E2) component
MSIDRSIGFEQAPQGDARRVKREGKPVIWTVPQLGNGIDSVVIQEWLVEIGEPIQVGEPLVVVETDKATSDLQSPLSGAITAIYAEEEAEVAVGEPLAELEGS